MVTLGLLLWLIPIAINVYVDRNGKKPNYALVNIVRGMATVVHGVIFDLMNDYYPKDWTGFNYWETLLIFLPLFTFQVTSYWILFELALNKVRGREPLYYDRKERDSGWVDRLFDYLGNGAHLAAKLACLGVCVMSIIIIYHTV